ncbi:MAG: T9SS type A sorting domain-containing protein [Saprospiraceae bacterium]|nr:T9SS type A sorting domain-containing protein [Saprospiraceae bacterium]
MSTNTTRRFRLFSFRFFPVLIALFALAMPEVKAQQNDPLCFQLYFPKMAANPGETVCLPLRCRDFNSITSAQFAIFYDANAFDFVGVNYTGSPLTGFGPSGYNLLVPGQLRVSWFDPEAMGVTLPDSTDLFFVCLKAKNNASGFFPFEIGSAPAIPYEVIQMLLLPQGWTFAEMPLAQQIGGISVGAGVPSNALALASTCVAKSTCGASVGSISVDVEGGQPPYSFSWSGPAGFASAEKDLSALTGGLYSLTVTDQAGVSVTAFVNVQSTSSNIYIQKTLKPAICGQPNGCATLTIFGGQLPYTFSWSSGGSQTNENCALAAGSHVVSVTDGSGCTQVDTFNIPNDTFLLVDVDVQNIYDCGGTGSATVTVLNSPVSYLWSTGGTQAVEDSLSAGAYEVTVTSPGGCSTVAGAWITDYSTFYWKLKLLTACDDPVSVPTGKLALQFNKSGGIAFPATVSWSDGSTRLIPAMPPGNILDSLPGVTSGLYSATVTDADGCSFSIQKVLNCAPPLPVPDSLTAFYIQDDYLTPQFDADSCTGVYARYFTDVFALGMTLNYNATQVNFKQIKLPTNPLFLSALGNFNVSPAGEIKFSWSNPAATGVSLPENSLLFEVCFTPKNTNPTATLNFTQGNVVATYQEIPFLGKNGKVLFGLDFPLGPPICEYGALSPSCATDGYGSIRLGGCDPGDPVIGNYIHDNVYFDNLTGLNLAEAGTYFINAYQTAQGGNSFFAYIPYIIDSLPCVWPGDADDNNAVNHHDLLYLGLAYGSTGAQRSGASLDWQGQDCTDWPAFTSTRNINFKNIDGNGDGVIDAADTLAIVQNWGRVVNPAKDDPFNAPLGNPTGNNEPPFTIQTDTLAPGQTAALPLLLGSLDMPADSIYGLAFSISYDPRKVKSNVSFKPSDSWLGQTSQMLWLQKNFPEQGRLDVAITRLDGMPMSGWGPIGDVFVIIEDNIFFAPPNPDADFEGDTTVKTLLFFSGLSSVHPDEEPLRLDAPPVELVILKSTTSLTEPASWERQISVAPNPGSDEIRFSSPESEIRRLEMLNLTGSVVVNMENKSTGTGVINVRDIPTGTYFVKVYTDRGIALKKVSIVH